MNSPKHVAIIMDGNGRWGIRKKKSRNYGHAQGVKVVEKIIEAAIFNKVKHLIQQQDENEPILDDNIPFEIDGELDIQNLIGKVIEGKIYNGKSRLLKMRRIEL